MMQAAGNPLLAMLGAAPAGMPPAANSSEASSATGFAALFASVQGAQSGAEAVVGQKSPLDGALKALLPVLDDLKSAISEAEGLPTDVAEGLIATLDQLTEGLSDWIKGDPLSAEGAEKLAAFLPDGLAEALLAQGEGLSLEQTPPLLLVHVLQQTTLSLVSDISSAVTSGDIATDLPQPINLGGVMSLIAKTQLSGRPPAPGQHPVAILSQIGPIENPLGLASIELSEAGFEALPETLKQMTQAFAKSDLQSLSGQPIRDFFQQVALSPAHAAGAIDIPKDMVQIVPESIASALQSVSETQVGANQAQQVARPDAPQTKFTQAVIGQLRSAQYQEGTTKVELTPRGLGNVEIEMKTNSDGSLSVVVRAESAHVLSSLREERELLAQIIAQGGEASVDFQEFSSGDQQGFDEQTGFTGGVGSGEGADDALAEASQEDTIGDGRLDLMT